MAVMDMALIAILVILLALLLLSMRSAFWPKPAGSAIDLTPVLDRLQLIKGDVERLDRVVREDGDQARSGADERGRLLREEVTRSLNDSRSEMSQAISAIRSEIVTALNKASQELRDSSGELSKHQKERLDDVAGKLKAMTDSLETRLEANRSTIETRLAELRNDQIDNAGKLRESLQTNLTTLRNENSEKLEQMRLTVDEKLQGTLEKRLGESFKQVSERLEAVHSGLGEMKTLATGVGDLKKILSNVKDRGSWGEAQLANLLAQVFSPEQYAVNVATREGSSERVEFAIRLPGRGPEDGEVLLPIDAKFPREDYERLVDASDRGDAEAVEQAAKALENRIKASAREIRDKYINPPRTTDFAILFLPTEGLYAEILRRAGLADLLQNSCRIIIAGPTTLNAILNSLLMGFRTIAIERRSSEVWEILGAVKTEFQNYGAALDKVQKKLQEASSSVDKVTVRQRAITRKLRAVSELSEERTQALLEGPGGDLALEPEDVDIGGA